MTDPSPDPHVRASIDPSGVATVTAVGEKSPNIVGTPAIAALAKVLGELAARPDLRVVVLRGAGEHTFIGGADIREMSALTPDTAPAFITGLRRLCDAVRDVPVPVIARLSGWCLGAGLELAMACDLRIAAEDATFGMPEVKVGIPSVIHAALMPRLIGASPAAWLLLTGEPIDAAQALSWGLVHRCVSAAGLDEAVQRCAQQLAALGPAVLRQQKALLRSWETMPTEDAIAASVSAFAQAFATGEPQAYMAAFTRRPR